MSSSPNAQAEIKLVVLIPAKILEEIEAHGEAAYPEEGAGLLLGLKEDTRVLIHAALKLENEREEAARLNRYLLSPQDYLRGEREAERLGVEVLGIFHSHPDHPDRPSEFDREWALPGLSYLITSVQSGKAVESKSWKLSEDRSQFVEEEVIVSKPEDRT